MARLTANVILANPANSGSVEFLAEGSTLPEWAEGLVGDHVLDRDEPVGHDAMKVDDLKAAIDERNEGRDESDVIVPDGTRKADLIAALVADDNR